MSLLNDALRNVEKRQRQAEHANPVSARLGAYSAAGPAPQRWKWLAIALLFIVAVVVAVSARVVWRSSAASAPGVAEAANVAPMSTAPTTPPVVPVATPAPSAVTAQSVARPPAAKEVIASESATATATTARSTKTHQASRHSAATPSVKPVAKRTPAPKPVAERHKLKVPAAGTSPVAKVHARTPAAPRAVPVSEQVAPAASGDAGPSDAVIRPARLTADEQDQALATRLQTLLGRGDADGAMALFRQAATPGQSWRRSRIALVSGLLSGQRYKAVLTLVPEAMAASSPRLRMLRARALLATSGARSALVLLKKSIPEMADWPDYHAMLATLYQQLGQTVQAATIWSKLLQLDNSRADWWAGLGIALDSEHRAAEAREAYRQAMMLSGLNPPLRQYVAQRLSSLSAQENE